MTYAEIQSACKDFRGALLTEWLIAGRRLHTLEKSLRVVFALSLLAFATLHSMATMPFLAGAFPSFAAWSSAYVPLARLVALTLFPLWSLPALCYAYFASYYFKDNETALLEPGMAAPAIRYELARIASSGMNEPLFDFFASPYYGAVFRRLGVNPDTLVAYLKDRKVPSSSFELKGTAGESADLEDFATALLVYDESLSRLLASEKLEAADFTGAAGFVSRIERRYKSDLRWWGRDSLGKIPGIGKDWAYGETALLKKYAVDISRHTGTSGSRAFGKREADEIERILSRGREANVLLVGEEGVPKLAPLARLARRIDAGTVLPPLEHKRIFVFDGMPFISALKEKGAFETEMLRLLLETVRAGNIIFVFDNFDRFFEEAKLLGSDILALLDPFLTSASIQIVALSEVSAFRRLFEGDPKARGRFERVLIEGASVAGSLPALEDEALAAERQGGVFFTYPAIRAIAASAERYFFEGVMPDKAIDLLSELVPKAKAEQKRTIAKEDVLELVSRKTGIALSEATSEERTKLLRLEEILHERIVGQDEAVKAISGALRRARSGISSPNRPMGSFLFLGPTGVGKTETTKALASAFFGNEKEILRFDMSEYQSDDALSRLIGTFESGKPGALASMLREHPYGVLLLDEFEKTSTDVHDLFLQILDEGFFTDVAGKRVNARNLIVIATSNAASDVLWNMKHEAPDKDKDIVITEIINRGIFKPELLNRFDGVVLFHPLQREHLQRIARLQLEKLCKRLREKGIELVITDTLIDSLVSAGQDPKFGARPMNRAIQEKVEQVIAEKMLRGELAAGSRVELTSADLSPVGLTSASI